MATTKQPHAVCIPCPAQGHINAMTKLAKILHHRGFYITFVHTEHNYQRFLRSRATDSLKSFPDDFHFETIPDGLPPPEDPDATQDIMALCISTSTNCAVPFRNLLAKLNDSPGVPPVSFIVSDSFMSSTLDAAEELDIPEVLYCPISASSFMCYLHLTHFIERGVSPFKGADYLTNGVLDTVIDWIPGIEKIRLRDIPSQIRTTDPNDPFIEFCKGEMARAYRASSFLFNTFDDLERDALDSLSSMLNRIYTVGPLQLLLNHQNSSDDSDTDHIGSNLWKEDSGCLQWLDSKQPESVVYVNFGSLTVITPEQLLEFAWGLADSMQNFLWIIRPDLVIGNGAASSSTNNNLPPEFVTSIKDRGMLASWCAQDKVLNHPSIGGFLTHSGWNSTIESVGSGVPIICWPFYGDQQTNCYYSCTHWGIGMEIDNDVKREKVDKLVRELMEGQKGKEMKKRVMEWKKIGEEATTPCSGSSYLNFDKMIQDMLLSTKKAEEPIS